MGFRFVDNKYDGEGAKPHQVFYRDRSGRDRARTVADLVEAGRIIVAETEPDASWGVLPVDAIVDWVVHGVEHGRRGSPPRGPGYLKNVKARLRGHFLSRFAGVPVRDIKVSELSAFRLDLGDEKRQRPLRPQTITAICHTVDMLFRECAECGIIPGPPPSDRAFSTMARAFRPRTIRYPTKEECDAMLATEDPVLLYVAMLTLHAAMAEDEISALCLADVRGGYINVERVRLLDGTLGAPGNSERIREIRLLPPLKRYMQDLGWKGFDRSRPIIEQLDPGVPHKPLLVGRRFRKLQTKVGVVNEMDEPRYTPKEGQHACIIGWLSRHHDLEEIRRRIGIASVERLLETYAKWVFDPEDVAVFDEADRELSAELSAEGCADYGE